MQGAVQGLMFLVVLATSIWVLIDAKRIGARKGQLTGLADLGPWGWFFACLLLWIIAFPLYLAKRPEFKRIAAEAKRQAEMEHEATMAWLRTGRGIAAAEAKLHQETDLEGTVARASQGAEKKASVRLNKAQRTVIVLGGLLLLGNLLYPPWVVTAQLRPTLGRRAGLFVKRRQRRSYSWVFSPPSRYLASSPRHHEWSATAVIDARRLLYQCVAVTALTALAVRIPFGEMRKRLPGKE